MNLDVETLKQIGTPHYFGLGFIQLKIDVNERLHFYHPDLMPILDEEELHNHRYRFKSTVLKGSLANEVFTFQRLPFTDLGLFEVSCKREDAGKAPHLLHEGVAEPLCAFDVLAGGSYELHPEAYHRIRYHEPTVTLLSRGPIVSDYARVIRKIDAPSTCPFSKVMTDAEIWEIIEQVIA